MEIRLTFNTRVSRWIAGWTVADRAVAFDAARGIGSTSGIGARIDGRWSGAEASLDRVSDTSRLASTGETANIVRANGVGSARIAQTFVNIQFTVDLRVTIVTWRAQALGLVGDGPAHGIGTAGTRFQTG